MKVFSPFLNGDTTTSGSLNLPQHPTASAIINPNTGSIYHDTTDNIVKVYTGTQWQVLGEQTTPSAGPASADVEYLLVAGGGGGGSYGGGGAGGYLSSSLSSVTSGSTFTVAVGTGGAGSGASYVNPGAQGVDSSIAGASISTITALGGGSGGDNDETGGADGGSGGGGSDGPGDNTGGTGTVGQGNDGGDGTFSDPNYVGGGGGGAGTAGGDATLSPVAGGDGGNGLASSITGTSTTRGGGGGGVTWQNTGTAGSAGSGGGGAGGTWNANTNNGSISNATAGTANTGGGGGCGNNGGSGVAIFAYDSGSINGAGGIVGDAGNGRKYNQFNSSGTFTVGSTSDFQIITTDLVAHLDAGNFASRGASTWTDLTGNGHNATVNGATLTDNHYYSLDGSNDYFSIADSNNFDSQTITIETWTWFDTNKSYNQLYTKGPDSGEQFEAGGNSTGDLFTAVVWGTGRSGFGNSDLASFFTTNTWIHTVQVIDNTSGWFFYKNGTLVGTDTSKTGTTITYNSSALQLGGDTSISGRYLDGRFAQFRFYTKALTAAEVIQNYNATKTNFV